MEKNQPFAEKKQGVEGYRIYTPLYLYIYDWFVLQFAFRWIWKCPQNNILHLYNSHVCSRHADIGVGIGFFLKKCRFPTSQPTLLLIDANQDSLNITQRRLRQFHPQTHQANILEPIHYKGEPFSSIGLCSVLHCLPGPISQKAPRVFENLKPLLAADGVLFAACSVCLCHQSDGQGP